MKIKYQLMGSKNIMVGALLIYGFITQATCISSKQDPLLNVSYPIAKLNSRIDSLFNSEISHNEPGAAVLIVYDGKILVKKGYGLRDIESQEPITSTTNMRIASMTKQFTALSLLSLIDEGLLSLDDPVHPLFPYESFRGVTIEQLINHTSGLQDAESAFFTEWNPDHIAENKDILDWYAKENRKINQPGKKYEYNNGIYEFIPCMVESISKQEFSEYAKENVFQKSGMKNTNYFSSVKPIKIKEKAACYEKNELEEWVKVEDHYLNGLLGAGGIFTNLSDLFEYDQALRNRTILSNESHDLIFKPSSDYLTSKGDKRSYGMGWVLRDSVAYHSGSWMGANSYIKVYIDRPLTYVILMNRPTLFESDLISNTENLILHYLNTL